MIRFQSVLVDNLVISKTEYRVGTGWGGECLRRCTMNRSPVFEMLLEKRVQEILSTCPCIMMINILFEITREL